MVGTMQRHAKLSVSTTSEVQKISGRAYINQSSRKIWILSRGIELQIAKYTVFFCCFCLALRVNIDAIQEHCHTCVKKNVGFFFITIQSTCFFVWATLFWPGKRFRRLKKCKISTRECKYKRPQDPVTCPWLLFDFTISYSEKIWDFQKRR